MQTFPPAEAYDHFSAFAERIAVELPDQSFASLQDLLDDIQARVKKLEEKTKGNEPK